MKGLSTLMVVVVTIIVVLIAALVIVTIFGKQLGRTTETVDSALISSKCDLTCVQAKNRCTIEGKTTGTAPGWTGKVMIEGKVEDCNNLCTCEGSAPPGGITSGVTNAQSPSPAR